MLRLRGVDDAADGRRAGNLDAGWDGRGALTHTGLRSGSVLGLLWVRVEPGELLWWRRCRAVLGLRCGAELRLGLGLGSGTMLWLRGRVSDLGDGTQTLRAGTS